MKRSPDFLANLLVSMGYPNLESAHQALLGAALKTRPELLPLILEDATIYLDHSSEFKSTSASPVEPWGRADCWPKTSWVTLEETPKQQTGGSQSGPKCRFDIVVGNGAVDPAVRATAVIECKWGAGTSTQQLLRYGRLLTDISYRERYAKPLLILVSVDGAPPRSPAALAKKCGVPIAFVTWERMNPVIRAALPDADSEARAGLEEVIDKATRFLTDFGALVLGDGRIPLRQPKEDSKGDRKGKSAKAASPQVTPSSDDDDGDDEDRDSRGPDSRKQWRVLGSGKDKREFDNATLPERSALFKLAKALESELNQRHEGAGWRMVSPPHLGPRGDVQCDLAPQYRLGLPFASEEMRRLGHDADAWLVRIGEFDPAPRPENENTVRNARAFEAAKSHDVDDNGIYLRAIIRLHFSVDGQFSVSFGTNVEPYLIEMLPKKLRPTLDAHIGAIGNFSSSSSGRGTWQPSETLKHLHEQWKGPFIKGLPKCWVKSGKHGKLPTMWQRYAEVRDIGGNGPKGKTRVVRIADALELLLEGGCTCKGGEAASEPSESKSTSEETTSAEGVGWFADFFRACNEALRSAGEDWNLNHSGNRYYAFSRRTGLPRAPDLGIVFPGKAMERPGYVIFQMISDRAGQQPKGPMWQAAVDCTNERGGRHPVQGTTGEDYWRLYVQEVAQKGESDIPAAAKRTVEVLRAVVDDMRTRLGKLPMRGPG